MRTFSILSMCVAGLFGYDEARILIAYAAYAAFCQSEMEVPALNEVDELDNGRAVVAIVSWLLVLLTLLPNP